MARKSGLLDLADPQRSSWTDSKLLESVVAPTEKGFYRWRRSGSRYTTMDWGHGWRMYLSGGRLIFTNRHRSYDKRYYFDLPDGELLGRLFEAILFGKGGVNKDE